MDFCEMFEECDVVRKKDISTINITDRRLESFVEDAESEFKGEARCSAPVMREILKDRDNLKYKLSELNNSLRELKNPKGLRGNSQKRTTLITDIGKKREVVKKEIAIVKMKLQEIDQEIEHQQKVSGKEA